MRNQHWERRQPPLITFDQGSGFLIGDFEMHVTSLRSIIPSLAMTPRAKETGTIQGWECAEHHNVLSTSVISVQRCLMDGIVRPLKDRCNESQR